MKQIPKEQRAHFDKRLGIFSQEGTEAYFDPEEGIRFTNNKLYERTTNNN